LAKGRTRQHEEPSQQTRQVQRARQPVPAVIVGRFYAGASIV
jgi:hypothetical protein